MTIKISNHYTSTKMAVELIIIGGLILTSAFQSVDARTIIARPARPIIHRAAPRTTPNHKSTPKVNKETHVVKPHTSQAPQASQTNQSDFVSDVVSTFTGVMAANWFTHNADNGNEKKDEKKDAEKNKNEESIIIETGEGRYEKD